MHQHTTATLFGTLVLAAAASAQVIAIERPNGTSDLYNVTASGAGIPSLTGVNLLDCSLVGYARKDRLRLNLPRPGHGSGMCDHILLPGGGSLWNATQGADALVLQVTAGGRTRVLLRVPLSGGGVDRNFAVAPNGAQALVSANGDAWILDTLQGSQAALLTANQGSLGIESSSLRINSHSAFFIADQVLYRSLGLAPAVETPLPLLYNEEPLAECLLSRAAATLLVVVEAEDDERRLITVYADGSSEVLTPTPQPLPLPQLNAPLGPFVAVSPDGARAAWRTPGTSEELFVVCLQGGIPEHVTTEPDYPVYLDNIGVIGFGTPDRLCFFAGDRVISGITGQELIGAADMYAINFDPGCGLVSRNVSGTSGSLTPPFALAGTLTLEETVLDPLGQRFLVMQEPPNDEECLSCFAIEPIPGNPGYGTADLITDQEHFDLYTVGSSVVLLSEREQGYNEDVVVSLIPALDPAGSRAVQLAVRPEDTLAGHVASSGSAACLRLTLNSQSELLWLDVGSETLTSVFPLAFGSPPSYSRSATFDTFGSLIVGYGPQPNRLRWFRVPTPWFPRPLNIPARGGIALPY